MKEIFEPIIHIVHMREKLINWKKENISLTYTWKSRMSLLRFNKSSSSSTNSIKKRTCIPFPCDNDLLKLFIHTRFRMVQPHAYCVFLFFKDGFSNTGFTPPDCWEWNLTFCELSVDQGESNWVVSWSAKWVYFVLPDRPKFLTCITFGKIVLSKWSSNVAWAKSRLYTSSSLSR